MSDERDFSPASPQITGLVFTCPNCGQQMEAPPDTKGQFGICPGCQTEVPTPSLPRPQTSPAPIALIATCSAVAFAVGILFHAIFFRPSNKPATAAGAPAAAAPLAPVGISQLTAATVNDAINQTIRQFPVRSLVFTDKGITSAETFELVVPSDPGSPIPMKLGPEQSFKSYAWIPPIESLQRDGDQYALLLKTPLAWKIESVDPLPAEPGDTVSIGFAVSIDTLPNSASSYFTVTDRGTLSLKRDGAGWKVEKVDAPLLQRLSKQQ